MPGSANGRAFSTQGVIPVGRRSQWPAGSQKRNIRNSRSTHPITEGWGAGQPRSDAVKVEHAQNHELQNWPLSPKLLLLNRIKRMTPMNKSEFICALARHGEMSSTDAEMFFQAFQHMLEKELPSAGKIVFPGFCNFEVVEKPARKGRNSATGQEIDIPAKKSVSSRQVKNLQTK